MQKTYGLNRRRFCGARAATLMPSMRITSIGALVFLLASCASSGLYNMSDDWCAAHLNASAARCRPDSSALLTRSGSASPTTRLDGTNRDPR
jgi:hypothetical protein